MIEMMFLRALCGTAFQSELCYRNFAPQATRTVVSERDMSALVPRLVFGYISQPRHLYEWICMELRFE